MTDLLDKLHIYLKKYRVIAIAIIIYLGIECHEFIEWYKENFKEIQEWQNGSVVGVMLALIGALKFALEHILKDKDEEDQPNDGP